MTDHPDVQSRHALESHFELRLLSEKTFSHTRIPRHGIALLQALQFSDPDSQELPHLTTPEWDALLELCDETQLTLLVGDLCRAALPDWVRTRIDQNYLDNARRFARLRKELLELAESLSAHSIEFALLKGFSHFPDFCPHPLLRAQGDIDIWCLPERISEARDALTAIGYRAIGVSESRHLAPMIRETRWDWRRDYFAPDLPIPVDLHYQLWDAEREYLPGPSEKEVWHRRSEIFSDGCPLPALDLADTLAFAALHLLMHLLHGDVRLQRAWEIAFFLDSHTSDTKFWHRWQTLYSSRVRELQLVIFALARRWFSCSVPPLIADEFEALPDDIRLWIEKYGLSPIEGLFVPNKDELWLNMCLLRSLRAKIHIFFRRLLPVHAADLGRFGEVSGSRRGIAQRLSTFCFLLWRAVYHSKTLFPTCLGGLRWYRQLRRLGGRS
ncbi:MAG: nucleotidyltransferase family protein [Acidobacteriaceae bacterium]|nr:nucleotidyltransferase family protein [Acidobacteriaceae bacterium]